MMDYPEFASRLLYILTGGVFGIVSQAVNGVEYTGFELGMAVAGGFVMIISAVIIESEME